MEQQPDFKQRVTLLAQSLEDGESAFYIHPKSDGNVILALVVREDIHCPEGVDTTRMGLTENELENLFYTIGEYISAKKPA
jgi:hypothetical protein